MKIIKATIYDKDFLRLLKSTDEEVVSIARSMMELNLLQDIRRSFKKWNMPLELIPSELDDALINTIDTSINCYLQSEAANDE